MDTRVDDTRESRIVSSLILVALTDEFSNRAVELGLREMHHNARIAKDGVEVIDQTLDHRPDALVLSVELPGLNGVDIARALRALDLTRRVPILFVARDDKEAAKVAQANLPFVDWIVAPLNLVLFREQIDKLLRINAHATGSTQNGETTRLVGITDPLTGLYERHYLVHRLAYEAARAARYRIELACTVLGIDAYERAVQERGRVMIDQAIAEIARVLQKEARASDIIGHVGRDKFLVIMPHTDASGARQFAERIQSLLRESEMQIPFSLSAGITAVPGANLTENLTVLARAADALMRAQKQGANQIVVDWLSA